VDTKFKFVRLKLKLDKMKMKNETMFLSGIVLHNCPSYVAPSFILRVFRTFILYVILVVELKSILYRIIDVYIVRPPPCNQPRSPARTFRAEASEAAGWQCQHLIGSYDVTLISQERYFQLRKKKCHKNESRRKCSESHRNLSGKVCKCTEKRQYSTLRHVIPVRDQRVRGMIDLSTHKCRRRSGE
jgi:hypothetical protein